MEYETIQFQEPEAGIGLLVLNRPDRLNALSLGMLEDLERLFGELRESESVRVLVMTGAGRGFCSGADLKDARIRREAAVTFASAGSHLVAVQKKYANVILEMRRLPQPIIAAVNGPAAGGGMCLALASDVIIASPQASFTPSFINIGLTGGDMGSSYLLPHAVGTAKASEILLTGRTVSAQEAERIGMVSRLARSADTLMEEAMEVARAMLGKSPVGLRLTKETLNLNLNAPSLEAAIELENRNQSITATMPELLKALETFTKGR